MTTAAEVVRELALLTAWSVWILLLPGFAILSLTRARLEPELRWVYALGLGLALNPLLFELASIVSIPIGRWQLAALGLASAAVLFVRRRRTTATDDGSEEMADEVARPDARRKWLLAGAALFILVFAVRAAPLAGLDALPGVDGYQHTIVAQMFVDAKGIPDDYSPYATLETFTYHFGTHSVAASLGMVSGIDVHRVLMWLEPFLMAMAAMAVACLGFAIARSMAFALVAAAIGGLVSVFPAWLINWARLPQLAGVVLVTLVMARLISARDDLDRVHVPLVALLTAGTFLTHYRMSLVLGYGLVALLLWRAVLLEDTRLSSDLWLLARIVGLALVLVSPWILHVATSVDPSDAARPRGLPPEYAFSLERLKPVTVVATAYWLPALSLIGLVVAVIKRRTEVAFLTFWVLLILVFSNPYVVPLPWSGYVDFLTVVSSIAFVPLSILSAYALTTLIGKRILFGLALVVVIGLGILHTRDVLLPGTVWVYDEDLAAFEWIKTNTSPDSSFASSTYVSFNGLVAPTDGGAWIAYFTGRKQSVPPLVYGNEQSPTGSYEALESLAELSDRIASRAAYEELLALGITHLYSSPRSFFDDEELSDAAWYRRVYSSGGINIYEVSARTISSS